MEPLPVRLRLPTATDTHLYPPCIHPHTRNGLLPTIFYRSEVACFYNTHTHTHTHTPPSLTNTHSQSQPIKEQLAPIMRYPGEHVLNLKEYMVTLDKPIGLVLAPDPINGQVRERGNGKGVLIWCVVCVCRWVPACMRTRACVVVCTRCAHCTSTY